MSQDFSAIIFTQELTESELIKETVPDTHTFNLKTLTSFRSFVFKCGGLFVPKYHFPYSISIVCMTYNEMKQE